MTTFTATIHQFEDKGEKSGWYYIDIAQEQAEELFPGNKKTFRVCGTLDQHAIHQLAVLPMGDGSFILPLNLSLRKMLHKSKGATLKVAIEKDDRPLPLAEELMDCLKDEPDALNFFNSLNPGHQRYFSNWIDSAKTIQTKAKRLAICLNGLSQKMDFGEMIRAQKKK